MSCRVVRAVVFKFGALARQEFYKYGSSESKLYLDAAGHLQYANFAIPALGLGSNVICAFNPQRSDAEVQVGHMQFLIICGR